MPVPLDQALFNPRGIAIVGASNDPAKLSGRPLDYLLRLGYKGKVYPVNPNRSEVQGRRALRTLDEIEDPVDLAIIVVPSVAVTQALRDCAKAGVTAAIIFASGFAEMGGKGVAFQNEVEAIAKDTGIRVLGPNCLGTFCLPTAAFATFSSAFDVESQLADDPVGLVSQSGAVGTFIYTTMLSMGLGVRYYANTGNEADVTVGEILCALALANDTQVLIGYLEDARRLDKLEQAARNAKQQGKPLILLKAGATAAGARAVGLHTGSKPGSDEEFSAILKRHGAIRVDSMEAAADAALIFRAGRKSLGRRLVLITQSGGAAALAADAAVKNGLCVDELSAGLQSTLRPLLPEYGATANPVDLTGALLTDPALLDRVLAQVLEAPEIDMILLVLGNSDRGGDAIVEGIHQAYQGTKKPFIVSWSGGSGRPRQRLLELKIPTYSDPHRAVRAMRCLAEFSATQP